MFFRTVAAAAGRFARQLAEQLIVMALFQLVQHLIDRMLARIVSIATLNPVPTTEGTS